MSIKDSVRNIQKYSVYLTIFFLPLVVTSAFANTFSTGKIALLTFGVAFSFLLWGIYLVLTGKLFWGGGRFDIGVILLALSYLASAILRTPNKMEAFLLPGAATVVAAGALIYFLVNQLEEKGQKILTSLVFYSGVVFSLVSLLATTNVLAKIPQLPEYVKLVNFNTLGGHLPAVIFLGTILPLGLPLLLKERDMAKRLFVGVSTVIVLLGLVVAVRESVPGKPQSPRLVSFDVSWNIAVDTLQASPFLGIGPGNYLTAFNGFRPLSYNQTELWSLRFTTGRDFYLTVITEAGLFGTFALVVLLLAFSRVLKSHNWTRVSDQNTRMASLILLLVFIAIFPASPYLTVLFFVLLGLNSEARVKEIDLAGGGTNRVPALIVSLPLLTAVLALFFFGGRALAAEAKFKNALDKLAGNDGKATYDLLREAVNKNPYVDRYRATYSQVNLALAQNIAQKEEIADEDRQTIAALIQQAIREAKSVAALNTGRSGNWEILARTYQSITAFAQGADTFALQSFNQAIALDPINPNLRIALGGLYYALGNYDEAINTFRLAVIAKPDLANAHYNLAAAYREKGDTDAAIKEMTTVLSLVDKSSADFELASEVMTALEEKRASEVADTENLTTPEGSEQVLEPPLTLPEDSQPPGTLGD